MNININCPINDLGYGVVSKNIVKSLHNIGAKVSLFPIGEKKVPLDFVEHVNNSLYFDYNAPSVKIYHQWEMASRIGKGKHIGFPFFELDKFTDYELNSLKSMDEIFVCSQWSADICDKYGLKTKVVPLGVDTKLFYPIQNPQRNTLRFINIGKYEIRKGHDILPVIFSKAFPNNEDVELWVSFDNPFYTAGEMQYPKILYKNMLGSKVKFLPRVETQYELNMIMNKVDCGIFPARAEGWNLEALELMGCGKPSVITNYHGHTEFCNQDNSFLVDIDEEELAVDNKWFNVNSLANNGNWAKIGEKQIDTFVDYLRQIYNNRSLLSTKSQNCLNFVKKFSWEDTAKKVMLYAYE